MGIAGGVLLPAVLRDAERGAFSTMAASRFTALLL
jgi:hypothetical protein